MDRRRLRDKSKKPIVSPEGTARPGRIEPVPLVGPPPAHIIESEIDGDISLYDPNRAEVLVLNSTASDIWRLSDGRYTLERLISTLAEAYQTDSSSIRPEVEATVRDLVDRGFLVLGDAA